MAKTQLQKLTVMVPRDLLRKARKATKAGATPTVRKGLELLATQDAYDQLLQMRGKGGFSMTWQALRGDE